MGKFKDKHGRTRWQEAKSDVKTFLDKHGDDIGPVVKAVVKVAVPRVANVVDLVDEIKRSRKGTANEKAKVISALESLLEDLDDDDEDPDGQALAFASEKQDPVDMTKLVNSTWASKFIGPVVMVLMSLLFFATWATEIAVCWGANVQPVPIEDKTTISLVFSALFGIRQISRSEAKKKILSQ